MGSSDVATWSIPLHQRPTVVSAGVVDHGQKPVDRWWLPRVWCLHFYRYEAELILDGQPFAIQPNCVGVIPPGVHQEYRYHGLSRHSYVHFELPSGGPGVAVPVMADLGERFAPLARSLEQAIGDLAIAPMRCHVRVWDLLWELSRAADDQGPGDARQRRAMALIERSLDQEIAVESLARAVGVSHNQLTRIFRTTLGETVIGYIRRRRVERAVHLLTATDLPVSTIGARVGIPDPQAFNKTVRAIAGRAPREFRS